MYTICKTLNQFSAAHRLVKGYQGKCRNLHGHNYKINVTLGSGELDEFDFLADFGDVMKLFDRWVQDHLDHATLVSEADPILLSFVQEQQQDHYIIPNGRNTTVEAVAEHLYTIFNQQLEGYNRSHGTKIKLTDVTVYETDTSCAAYAQANA